MSESKLKFEDLTFGKAVKDLALASYITSTNEYYSKLNDLLNEKFEAPLFVDTNVLLRYYRTSLKYRSALLDFFNKIKENIFLTYTVQVEFVRNREDVIDQFISISLNKFRKDFETKFINGLEVYSRDIQSHLDDFPEIEDSIKAIQNSVAKTYSDLSEKIAVIEEQLKGLKKNDDYLNMLSETHMRAGFNEKDTTILKQQFDHFSKELGKDKSDRENKTASIFPGYLDIGKKEANPYGDYIIFHEIIHYMLEKQTDAILLTFDTKGDWIQKNGEAHSHYIQIAHSLTGKHLFIIDAERYFSDKLKNNFAPVTLDAYNEQFYQRRNFHTYAIEFFAYLNSVLGSENLSRIDLRKSTYVEVVEMVNMLIENNVLPNKYTDIIQIFWDSLGDMEYPTADEATKLNAAIGFLQVVYFDRFSKSERIRSGLDA